MSFNPTKRYILLQVITPHTHQEQAIKDMKEFSMLVDTLGGQIIAKAVQHRVKPHPATHIGAGKVDWLKVQVTQLKLDVIVINAILPSSIIFRLEKILWEVNPKIEVWDRVDLILHIFDAHAVTREAKLQIELARLAHLGPRIYGLGRTVLSRQGGGFGQRGGAGETNIEKEKRLLKDRTKHLKKELRGIAGQKQDRLRFRAEQGYGPVALVGYTSAGKTTLFNQLTGKRKDVHASLFTTLDTVVGKLIIPHAHLPILISDTIGFIRNLPPNLIDAFHSTLLESLEAKLILHVVDASDSNYPEKIATVHTILTDLNVTQPIILVFNKIDHLNQSQLKNLKNNYALPTQFISAQTRQGLPDLTKLVTHQLLRDRMKT
jgi:GTP-binding protein HflX